MSLDYEKVSKKHESTEQWASYSDLFMVLSVVFLLLYVVASLRTGTHTISQQLEQEKLKQQNADLEKQIKVYNSLKENYIETQASMEEQEVYKDLMKKLELLQEENHEEAKNLRAQAHENEQKEKALNQYQQIIRNIINANVLAKSRIERRDQKIAEAETTIENQENQIAIKDQTIQEKSETIKQLDSEVESKQQIIAQKNSVIQKKQNELKEKQQEITELNEDIRLKKSIIQKNLQEIGQIDSALKKQMQALKNQKAKQKMTETQFKQKMAALQAESKGKIEEINQRNKVISSKLSEVSGQVELANQQLQDANKTIQSQQELKNKLGRELASIQDQMAQSQEEFKEQKKTMESQITGLESEKTQLSSDLKRAQENLNAKKKLAKQISSNFAKNGVNAQVDQKTGEVTLSFGKSFFDVGKANLKPEMETALNKFMPIYSQSLFSDPKVASKIKSVDIIGYASPTYKGRYINPRSMDPKDKQAIEYNTDLSFKRAKSVFNHIIDADRLNYKHQKNIRPLLKVSGRSFFSGALEGRAPAQEMSQSEFCKQYNCNQEQKVIIKFELED